MASKLIIGREKEIRQLENCYASKESQLVILYGRRRVGKTFLINQTFGGQFTFKLVGDYTLKKDGQLNNFHEELRRKGGTAPVPKDWQEAFYQLRDYLDGLDDGKKHVVFFDEMPWLDNHKSGFLAAFEYFWNSYGSSKDDLLFIVCGSATSWLVENIDHNRGGLFNRQNLRIYLEPFTLRETELFLASKNISWSRYDICECYMILGGIPYYLNMLDGEIPFSANIDRLFFGKHALLWDEFDHLYKTLFSNSDSYIKIVEALSSRRIGLSRKELVEKTKMSDNTQLSKMLKNLVDSGFVREYPFYGNKKRLAMYQLSDYFTMFQLRFVRGKRGLDERFWSNSLDNPARKAWAGLTFEQLCKDHIRQIKRKIGIAGVLSSESSWFVQADEDHDGAQIDMLIDRRDRVINICEMKFAGDEYVIDKDCDADIRRKISRFTEVTGTRKALQLTFITTYGVKLNMYSQRISSQVTLDDLFADPE
ncbi:MAG: AAA family ATPase [Treponema sp.]|nr:AAA family ATPase [Treponema sp.]